MVDGLEELGVDILFAIGGDGTLRGACALEGSAGFSGSPEPQDPAAETCRGRWLPKEQASTF